jgi:hypothetical protein
VGSADRAAEGEHELGHIGVADVGVGRGRRLQHGVERRCHVGPARREGTQRLFRIHGSGAVGVDPIEQPVDDAGEIGDVFVSSGVVAAIRENGAAVPP